MLITRESREGQGEEVVHAVEPGLLQGLVELSQSGLPVSVPVGEPLLVAVQPPGHVGGDVGHAGHGVSPGQPELLVF